MSIGDWAGEQGQENIKWLEKMQKERGKTTKMTEDGILQRVKIGEILYVNKVDKAGWVLFKLDTGKEDELCKFTKLRALGLSKDQTRVHFQILDGSHEGKTGSMRIKNGADKYLGTKPPIQAPAIIKAKYGKFIKNWETFMADIVDQQMASFEIEGKTFQATLNSDTPSSRKTTPLPVGRYEILIPDFSHDKAREYRDYSNYESESGDRIAGDTVWFPIAPKHEHRYIHMGQVSSGCFTVLDFVQYNLVHEYLIKHRTKGKDGKNIIGYLEISK